MFFVYTVLCTEDGVYKSFVCIFVRKLVTYGLDGNRLVMDGPDIINKKDRINQVNLYLVFDNGGNILNHNITNEQ